MKSVAAAGWPATARASRQGGIALAAAAGLHGLAGGALALWAVETRVPTQIEVTALVMAAVPAANDARVEARGGASSPTGGDATIASNRRVPRAASTSGERHPATENRPRIIEPSIPPAAGAGHPAEEANAPLALAPSPPLATAVGDSASGGGMGVGVTGGGGSGGAGGGMRHEAGDRAGAGRGAGAADRRRLEAIVFERVRQHRRYPELARRRGAEGTVKLAFRILSDGRVTDLMVRRGADPMLDEASLEAVRSATPLPPLDGTLEIELEYSLADSAPATVAETSDEER